jgi:hypothetical protein
MFKKIFQIRVVVIFIIAMLWSTNVMAADKAKTDESDKWQFSVQPYAWLPTLDADMKFSAPNGSSGSPSVSIEPDDYLDNLELAAITTIMARKGKWSFSADFIYMKLSTSESAVKSVDFLGSRVSTNLDIGSDVEMKNFISTFGGGYQIIDNHWLKMDVFAGARYLWIESQVDWRLSGDISGPNAGQTFSRSGSQTESDDLWNGVGGVKGSIILGKSNWFIPFEADVGAGDSDLTWQVFSALGYSFNNRFDAMFGFRQMEFEQDEDELIQDLRLSGPVLGIRFRF